MNDDAARDQVRSTWPNGVVMVSGLQGPQGPVGEWSWFDDSGAIRWRATFVDGELEGLAEHWYPGGSQRKAGRYAASRREGLWRAWFAEGPPMCEGVYADDRMVGEWTWFDLHGGVLARHAFNERGLPEGYKGFERRYREVHLDPGDPTVCERCGGSAIVGLICRTCGLITEGTSFVCEGAFPELTGPPGPRIVGS